MKNVLVWDLPVRFFHVIFGLGFLSALGIAKLLGDDSPLFPWHAIIGLCLATAIGFRLVWGVVGSRHARLSGLVHSPASVARYFLGVLTGKGGRLVGHNPGSGVVISLMLLVVLGVVGTGVAMGLGSRGVREVHELLTYAMLGLVGLHLAGILVHTVRFREWIALSMVHGFKRADPAEALPHGYRLASVFLVATVALTAFALRSGLDPATGRIQIAGVSLRVGEGAERDGREWAGSGEARQEANDE